MLQFHATLRNIAVTVEKVKKKSDGQNCGNECHGILVELGCEFLKGSMHTFFLTNLPWEYKNLTLSVDVYEKFKFSIHLFSNTCMWHIWSIKQNGIM